ncbi:uncharacterized protein [Lolium perenne]|uniref:uncharacterized protein n=1 Tax=Lolium perenne TaxID=4522 RepID=UPI003A9A3471
MSQGLYTGRKYIGWSAKRWERGDHVLPGIWSNSRRASTYKVATGVHTRVEANNDKQHQGEGEALQGYTGDGFPGRRGWRPGQNLERMEAKQEAFASSGLAATRSAVEEEVRGRGARGGPRRAGRWGSRGTSGWRRSRGGRRRRCCCTAGRRPEPGRGRVDAQPPREAEHEAGTRGRCRRAAARGSWRQPVREDGEEQRRPGWRCGLSSWRRWRRARLRSGARKRAGLGVGPERVREERVCERWWEDLRKKKKREEGVFAKWLGAAAGGGNRRWPGRLLGFLAGVGLGRKLGRRLGNMAWPVGWLVSPFFYLKLFSFILFFLFSNKPV